MQRTPPHPTTDAMWGPREQQGSATVCRVACNRLLGPYPPPRNVGPGAPRTTNRYFLLRTKSYTEALQEGRSHDH